MGGGTSGRLGVLDATECVPTLASSQRWFKASSAVVKSNDCRSRGAEDSKELGRQDLVDLKLSANDIVVGIK